MSNLVLLLAVIAAVAAMAWILNQISCPFCKSKNVTPGHSTVGGFAILFECLKCHKTFYHPPIDRLGTNKKER